MVPQKFWKKSNKALKVSIKANFIFDLKNLLFWALLVGCLRISFYHEILCLYIYFWSTQPAHWDRRLDFYQKCQKVFYAKTTFWSFWWKSSLLSHCAGCILQKSLTETIFPDEKWFQHKQHLNNKNIDFKDHMQNPAFTETLSALFNFFSKSLWHHVKFPSFVIIKIPFDLKNHHTFCPK